MINRRFLFTLVTIVIIAIGALAAVYLAKGYRISPETGQVIGTGIISATSVPDQASIYLDDHLISATNANINNLEPKKYTVKIHKDGYIDWIKEVEVQEGLVSEVKATLYPALPSVYPLTFNGAIHPSLSPDGLKLAYVVPTGDKKGGVWAWTFSSNQIGFARGGEPHQVMLPPTGVDLTNATLSWSPDSKQLLLSTENRNYLLEQDRLNDPPRDITPILQPTLKSWSDDQAALDKAKLEAISDLNIRRAASASASLKWSPDETKFIFADDKQNYKSVDLKTNEVYDLPLAKSYAWLPDSVHLVVVDQLTTVPTPTPGRIASPSPAPVLDQQFPVGKISVIEYEGTNKSEIYAGNFDTNSVFAWPDGSRLVMLYALATNTASVPNLYGINLK